MTSEADFYAAMDAEPENIDIRGIFADWLDERNDPIAAGWRALWVGGYTAVWFKVSKCWGFYSTGCPYLDLWDMGRAKVVPEDWVRVVKLNRHVRLSSIEILHTPDDNPRYGPRVLLKALAVTFTKLPAERQAELLRPATTPASAPAPA